jgi:hypothetical protein
MKIILCLIIIYCAQSQLFRTDFYENKTKIHSGFIDFKDMVSNFTLQTYIFYETNDSLNCYLTNEKRNYTIHLKSKNYPIYEEITLINQTKISDDIKSEKMMIFINFTSKVYFAKVELQNKTQVIKAPDWQKWVTLSFVLSILFCLVFGVGDPTFVFFFFAVLLYLCQIVTFTELYAGFSNEGMITIGVLYGVSFYFIIGSQRYFRNWNITVSFQLCTLL